MKYSIHNESKVRELLKENGFPEFRYKQIANAIYKNYIKDFHEMGTIPKKMREMLDQNFSFETLSVDTQVTSADGQTTKILFKTSKSEFIEAVIMRHKSGRNTLCISCQVGCPMACTFCAT
jgi:23S rRNA (adenine-C8)-methyltransferase